MTWWRRVTQRSRLEEQLDKELLFHLEQHAADLRARGLTSEEAHKAARLALGGPEQVKEECRDARGTRWLEDLLQDIRFTLRSFHQKPGFAAVTLFTLAVGIAATTVMFTMVDNVLLKPLPFPEPERLVAVLSHQDNSRYSEGFLAYPDFLVCQSTTRSMQLAGWLFNSATLSEPGDPEYVQHFEITHNLFSVLRVPVLRGRGFLAEEDRPGGRPVAVLGNGLWQRHFGADPAVIDSSVVLDGRSYTIVGIAPPLQLDGDADIYTPLGQSTATYLKDRRAHPVRGVGRLHAESPLPQADAEMRLLGSALAAQFAETNSGRSLFVKPLRPDVDDVQSTLWLLLGSVTLILLIACANVASLMLARAVARERELAMKTALGAGRWRLVRECLTESAVLSLGGGALGLLLASAGLRPFLVIWPGGLPRAAEVQLDWRVAVFVTAISVLCGLFFGVAPAMRVSRNALQTTLRRGAHHITGGSRRLQGVFVVFQIALTGLVLISAGMLGRTLLYLSALDPGVDTQNVLVARIALPPAALTNPSRIRAAWDDVLDRARSVPGIQSVAIVDTVPMRAGHNENGYWTNSAVPAENLQPVALSTCVTPGYLKVMGVKLQKGRFFTPEDRSDTQRVIVIDEVLARTAFPGAEPVGKYLWIPDMGTQPQQIIGVMGHVRYWGLAGDDQSNVRAQFYYPFAQVPDQWLRRWSELMSIVVRTTIPPLSTTQPLRHKLRRAAKDQVLYEVRSLEQLAAASLQRQRFLLVLFVIFSALSLLLAATGIYGVLSYLTGFRIREFGVRMAIGATGRDILSSVFRQSLAMIVAGVACYAILAFAVARLLLHWVEGMQPVNVTTFLVMSTVLILTALLATLVPARRASLTDPIQVLRQD